MNKEQREGGGDYRFSVERKSNNKSVSNRKCACCSNSTNKGYSLVHSNVIHALVCYECKQGGLWTNMSNIKIGGKYVLYWAIESMYYNEEPIKGDVLHTNTLDEQKGQILIENTLRMIHEYLQHSD